MCVSVIAWLTQRWIKKNTFILAFEENLMASINCPIFRYLAYSVSEENCESYPSDRLYFVREEFGEDQYNIILYIMA